MQDNIVSTPAGPVGTMRPYRFLHVETRDGVAWVTLSRPEKLNAIHPEMAEELNRYFLELCFQDEVRVVVLRAAGRHFCAGFDLDFVDEIASSTPRGMQLQRLMSDIVLRMRRCPQPIVALVQGAACGAGLAITLAADVRYAAHDVRMNVAMARVGLTGCDMGISYFLPRVVGRSIAAELMMSGRFVDSVRAARIGLVSEVVDFDSLQATGDALAQEMLAMSPLGLQLTKEGLAIGHDASTLEEALAFEDRGQVLCIGPFMREGVAAFREKRRPNYRR